MKRAFTLLEVLLTLALSVVLITLIGSTLNFYAVTMNNRDMDIRQVQLATAVLQMIEDDLRATVHPSLIDPKALETLLSDSASNAVSNAVGEDVDLSAAGIAGPEEPPAEEPVETTVDLSMGSTILQKPGLIGNQFQIQIDLSRMPRLEEYTVMLGPNSTTQLTDIPSEIKTVTYFVQESGIVGGIVDDLDEQNADSDLNETGGLVRRSLDRAATAEALANGSLSLLNQTGERLAPEITSIEFEYWDGALWQIQWSSDDAGKLPSAVKVKLSMTDPVAAAETTGTEAPAARIFTHTVRLPMSRAAEKSEEPSSTDDVPEPPAELTEAGV